jgi:hypothetical protein
LLQYDLAYGCFTSTKKSPGPTATQQINPLEIDGKVSVELEIIPHKWSLTRPVRGRDGTTGDAGDLGDSIFSEAAAHGALTRL